MNRISSLFERLLNFYLYFLSIYINNVVIFPFYAFYWLSVGFPLFIFNRFVWKWLFKTKSHSSQTQQPTPIEKDSRPSTGSLASMWDQHEGFVLIVDEYNPSDPPILKPRDVMKILESPKSKSSKKQILRDNLQYAKLNSTHAKLILTVHKTGFTQVLSLTDYSIELYPEDVASRRPYSRSYPILIKSTATGATDSKKKFFMFCPTGVAKERWYISMKKCSLSNINPRLLLNPQMSNNGIDTSHWLNALISRLWMTVSKTDRFLEVVRQKVVTKIERIKKPAFITNVKLRNMKIGERPPKFSNMAIENSVSALVIGGNVSYPGGFEVDIEAEAKSEATSVKVHIALSITLQELTGKIIVQMNPLPSSRIWWAFKEPPKMTLQIKPLVGERNIGYSLVRDAVQQKIQEAINDSLVLPNMEDVGMFGADKASEIWSMAQSAATTNSTDNSRRGSETPLAGMQSGTASPLPQNTPGSGTTGPGVEYDRLDTVGLIEAMAAKVPSLSLSPTMAARKNGGGGVSNPSFSPKLNSKLGNLMVDTIVPSVVTQQPGPQSPTRQQKQRPT